MKLILDTFCEVYDLLVPYADGEFWDFSTQPIINGAVYLLGRRQFGDNIERVRQIVQDQQATIILSNPHEGSDTLRKHIAQWGVVGLVKSRQILCIGGGDMDETWPCLQYDSFLPKLLDYDENLAAQSRSEEIYTKLDKPYKFLFLNGRYRPHRRHLISALATELDRALWTNLDSQNGTVHLLPPEYEFDLYAGRVDLPTPDKFVKNHLFNGDWGEIYLKAEPYIDTYFSVVTETVYDYPYSFRTEKIWKPMVMGHPFVAVSGAGYYRDLHSLGFRTFGHLIDESFDTIDNNQDRLDRTAVVIRDLCRQDLPAFVTAAAEVCKYNQQHYAVLRSQVRQEFPERFFQFLKKYNLDE